MKKYVIITLAVLGMASCSEKKFHVEGTITEAQDSVLYLENVGINEINAIDSVKLSADGQFSFSGEATEAPEFYRLRIADQIINVAIDSTETVTVKASYPKMATEYEVSGSENCQKIKELALKQMDLQRRAILISSDEHLTVDQSNDSILGLIKQYKNDVKKQYIFPAPNQSYAYFALFQTLGNMLLFNPRTDKEDIKVFAAVATNDSPARILLLRELYNKYHDQGFEIYQVSLDPDEHFWKQQTSALPWISVREEAGLNSSTIRIYNVQGVPEFFLIDRGNNLVGRSQTIKDIEEAIKNLL